MAESVVTPVLSSYPQGVVNLGGSLQLSGTLTIGAGTYATNGLPCEFRTLAAGVSQSLAPVATELYSPSSGYIYQYDPVHLTVRIFLGGAAVSDPLAELGNGATVPAGVTGDTVQFSTQVFKG